MGFFDDLGKNWNDFTSNLGNVNLGGFLFGDPGHGAGIWGGGKGGVGTATPNPLDAANAAIPPGLADFLSGQIKSLGQKDFQGTGTSATALQGLVSGATSPLQLAALSPIISSIIGTSQARSQQGQAASTLENMAATNPYIKQANDILADPQKFIDLSAGQLARAGDQSIQAIRSNTAARGFGGGSDEALRNQANLATSGAIAQLNTDIPLKLQQYLAPATQLQTALQSGAANIRAGMPISSVDFTGLGQQAQDIGNTVAGVQQYGQASAQNNATNLFNMIMSMVNSGTQGIPALGTLFNLGGFKRQSPVQPDQTGAILGGVGSIVGGSRGYGTGPFGWGR